MKTISKNLIVLSFVALTVLTSCGDALKPGWEYLVDNPLDKEIAIKIDDQEYTIPAASTLPIKLTEGQHTLNYNGSSVNFKTKVNSNKSTTIMNPTLSNYMLHAFFYVSERSKSDDVSRMYAENSQAYQSDSGMVLLPVRVLNNLFIEGAVTNWSFGLDEDAKSELSSRMAQKRMTLHKLYRQAQYLEEMAEELPAGVVFPANTKKLNELPAYAFPTSSMMCDCEGANKVMKELGEKCDNIIATSTDIFQDIAQLNYYAITDARREMMQQCSTQFNPGRDETQFEEALEKLTKEMDYLSSATSFIVK